MNRKLSLIICLVLSLLMIFSSTVSAISAVTIKTITLDKTAVTLEEGSTFTLKPALTPASAASGRLKWASSNQSVAKVNFEGTIFALKTGSTTITASAGKVTAKCVVTVVARKAPVEIKIPIYERGNQGNDPADNSFWSKWITENALKDINVKVTWVALPRNTNVEKYNLLLASGEAPDILFSYDFPVISAWYGRGALMEIPKSLLDQYGQNLTKFIPQSVRNFGIMDGKQYTIPGKRINSYYFMSYIRQDWLKKLKLPLPTSNEQQYQVLKAFKKNNLGGAETIPLGLSLTDVKSCVGNYSFRQSNIPEEELAMYSDVRVAALTWAPEKARLKYFNKLFSEGLVSPEFALDVEGHKRDTAFMNGQVGIMGTMLSKNPPILQTLVSNVPSALVATVPAFTTDFGGKPQGRGYWDFGMVNGINSKCKNPEAVIKYLDWMSKPEVLSVLQNGIEGKNYTVVNGKKVPVKDYKGPERLMNGTNKDYYCVVLESTSPDMGSDEKNMIQEMNARAPLGFGYLEMDSFKYTKQTNLIPDFFFKTSIESMTANFSALDAKWGIAATKLIMCKPADFESTYATLAKDYLASGYQKVLDEKKAVYHKQTGK